MLTAYWDLKLKIKDLPTDDPRVPMFPLESRDPCGVHLGQSQDGYARNLVGNQKAQRLLLGARKTLAYFVAVNPSISLSFAIKAN